MTYNVYIDMFRRWAWLLARFVRERNAALDGQQLPTKDCAPGFKFSSQSGEFVCVGGAFSWFMSKLPCAHCWIVTGVKRHDVSRWCWRCPKRKTCTKNIQDHKGFHDGIEDDRDPRQDRIWSHGAKRSWLPAQSVALIRMRVRHNHHD